MCVRAFVCVYVYVARARVCVCQSHSLCHISIQADMSGGSPEASDLIKTEINLIWDLLDEYDKTCSGLIDPDTYRRSRGLADPRSEVVKGGEVIYLYFLPVYFTCMYLFFSVRWRVEVQVGGGVLSESSPQRGARRLGFG